MNVSPLGPHGKPPGSPIRDQRPQFLPCWWETETFPAQDGSIVVLRVGGELDLLTYELLRTALTASLIRQPTNLVVDLAEVTFCGCQGLSILVQAASAASQTGIRCAWSGMPAFLTRTCAAIWHDHELPTRYPSAAAAVAAIRATVRNSTTEPADA